MSARPHDAVLFMQRRKRIGNVFQAMGGEDKIIGGIGDAGKVRCFAQKLAPGRPGRVETKFSAVAETCLPGGLRGKIDVVDLAGTRVDGPNIFGGKYSAGPADFQADEILPHGLNRLAHGGLGRPNAIVDHLDQPRQTAVTELGK